MEQIKQIVIDSMIKNPNDLMIPKLENSKTEKPMITDSALIVMP